MKQRRILSVLLAMVMMVCMIAGCSKKGEETGGESTQDKDTLVVLGTIEVESFDPLNTALNCKIEWHQIFDVLVEFQEDGTMGPGLAESFELTED